MSFVGDKKPELIREISPNDGMFDPAFPDAYFDVGQSAIDCIRLSMEVGEKSELRRILDFPCGHGRVLRALKHAFPEAELTASDIDHDGVDFCAQTFAARGVYSNHDLSKVDLEGSFDLIWVGSLFTHLPDPRWWEFLDFLIDRLASDGLLLFTTHGRWSAHQIREERSPLAGSRQARVEMLRAYDATGFGFVSAGDHQAYGTSLTKPHVVLQRIEAFEDLRLLSYFERGWGRHQDVVACQKGFTPSR
jgi:SAM-dependent methyltransferase